MSTAGLLVFGLAALALLCLSAAWVLLPLWRGSLPIDLPDPRVLALLERREALLATLRDLEADHRDGRIETRRHDALRADLLRQGGAILAALDQLAQERAGETARLGLALEAEITALGSSAASDVTPAVQQAGESPDVGTMSVSSAEDPDPRACSGCGRGLAADARFCDACGQAQ